MSTNVVFRGVIILGIGFLLVLYAMSTETKNVTTPPTTTTASSTVAEPVVVATTTEAVIARFYAPLIPLTLGSVELQASVADTEAERELGLSGTPYLPSGVVKVFIFETSNTWGFWMKDMQYAIDMIWLDETKTVVYVAQNATPESFPSSFIPPVPARYVIETPTGFAEKNNVTIGTTATW